MELLEQFAVMIIHSFFLLFVTTPFTVEYPLELGNVVHYRFERNIVMTWSVSTNRQMTEDETAYGCPQKFDENMGKKHTKINVIKNPRDQDLTFVSDPLTRFNTCNL